MAKVKDQLGQLGMGSLVAGLKALESSVSKKQFKRLIATAVAQLLTMHPDYGAGKVGVKETLGTAAAAAASGAALKVAGKVGRKLTERVSEAVGVGASSGSTSRREDNNDRQGES